jgi:hypothetical protein
MLTTIPNDDDLTQVYSLERKKRLNEISKERKDIIRKKKLNIIFTSRWEGMVKIKNQIR